jgi:hypothetical protein
MTDMSDVMVEAGAQALAGGDPSRPNNLDRGIARSVLRAALTDPLWPTEDDVLEDPEIGIGLVAELGIDPFDPDPPHSTPDMIRFTTHVDVDGLFEVGSDFYVEWRPYADEQVQFIEGQ